MIGRVGDIVLGGIYIDGTVGNRTAIQTDRQRDSPSRMRDDRVVKRTDLPTSRLDTAVDRAESGATPQLWGHYTTTRSRTLRAAMYDCEFCGKWSNVGLD